MKLKEHEFQAIKDDFIKWMEEELTAEQLKASIEQILSIQPHAGEGEKNNYGNTIAGASHWLQEHGY